MDISSILASFERDPVVCERALKEEEKRNCSTLVLALVRVSRPLQENGDVSIFPTALRLLALTLLQQLTEKYWVLSSSFIKRTKQPVHTLPKIIDQDKPFIMDVLLLDVSRETNPQCASKRAQTIATIAKHDWQRWPNLFSSLVGESPTPTSQMFRALTLHVVLKELSLQRVGTELEAFALLARDLYPKLFHQVSMIFYRTNNFEAMPDLDAELAARICKSVNSLIRGSTSVVDLTLGPYFEVVLASLSLRPTSPSTAKLLRALRKTCLVAMRNHPIMFRDFFLTVFAERTSHTLGTSLSPTGETLTLSSTIILDEPQVALCIFCFAFWTELVSQKAYQQQPAEAVDRFLAMVARQALVHLRMTGDDLERWRVQGGEVFCAEDDGDSDAPLVGAVKEDSVRRAARRFLQACFDQPLPIRADAVLGEIFGTQYTDSLAIEAAFLAVQLSAMRLHGKWNFDEFLRARLLPCLAPPTRPADALLARRACLVVRAWMADLTAEAVPVVVTSLSQVLSRPDCDLAVALAAAECAHALILEASPLPEAISPLMTISHWVRLFSRLELPDSKCKLMSLLETLILVSREPVKASEIISQLIPVTLSSEGKGLVEAGAIDLVATCVQSVGFVGLSKSAKRVCIDLISLASARSNAALDDVWPRLLLICLRTVDSSDTVRPIMTSTILRRIQDIKERCAAIEMVCLLWRFPVSSNHPRLNELPDLDFALWDMAERFHISQQQVVLTEQKNERQGEEGVLPRTDQDEPYEVLYVCRCLDTLIRTKLAQAMLVSRDKTTPELSTEAKRACWSRILNSTEVEYAVDAKSDSRDVIERVTIVARTILSQLASFASVAPATAFSALCLKYIDAVGFAPSEAAWRRRAWSSALLLTLSMCRGLSETRQVLPLVVQACAVVVRANLEDQGAVEPPCFSAVDEDRLSQEIDLHRARKERLFAEDEFLQTDIKLAFKKVWQMLVARFGTEQLAAVVADAENSAPEVQALMGAGIKFDKRALSHLLA